MNLVSKDISEDFLISYNSMDLIQ